MHVLVIKRDKTGAYHPQLVAGKNGEEDLKTKIDPSMVANGFGLKTSFFNQEFLVYIYEPIKDISETKQTDESSIQDVLKKEGLL